MAARLIECNAVKEAGPVAVIQRPDRSNALDRTVVLMFENRSFDNLLGRLYEPGEVASFEGVTGKDLSNPIPGWVADQGPGGGLVPDQAIPCEERQVGRDERS
jgi:phospholipase C